MRTYLQIYFALLLALLFRACRSAPTPPPAPTNNPAINLSSASASGSSERPSARTVRRPAVAGMFYPADGERLRRQVEGFLAAAKGTDLPGPVFGLLVPHAGYDYSGPVAAYAYKTLSGRSFPTVVLLGPSHYWPLYGAALPEAEAFRTPLGEVRVNRELGQRLLASGAGFSVLPEAHAREHSLEVQLPFLQCTLPDFDIVPLSCGELTLPRATRLAQALAEAIRGREVLVVASSDLSHFPAYGDAVRCDRALLEAIATRDAARVLAADRDWMSRGIPNLDCTLCGLWPVVVWLEVARELGIEGVKVLKYANSGDVPDIGDKDRVVGYGAVVLYHTRAESAGAAPASSEKKEEAAMNQNSARSPGEEGLSPAQQAEILRLARLSLESHVREGKPPSIRVDDPDLKRPCGAFVTLKKKGQLRGCIGSLQATEPLARTIIEMAGAAALQDSRFEPVRPEELADIDIEVSVLSPLRPISEVNEIEIGRHGLYLVQGPFRGVLLPQVATEQGWNREEFLQHTCRKAGLPADAWKKGAQINIFTAQVFGEKEAPE